MELWLANYLYKSLRRVHALALQLWLTYFVVHLHMFMPHFSDRIRPKFNCRILFAVDLDADFSKAVKARLKFEFLSNLKE